jgi:transposase
VIHASLPKAHSGLAVVIKASSEYRMVGGRVVRSKKQPLVRGLNQNCNRALKAVFKGAALTAAQKQWKSHYEALIKNGMDPSIAQVTLARKIAAITLAIWKKGERYDPSQVKFMQAA